ncbi:hypothetical protein MKK68_03750 [Methylobacterium sp. E-016]|uniref:hypothetical protein n=1 Tax=Methylobacterium sp. E-016 TaxID=2836556 RepID=UPI001FB9D2EC|nr:hypothetical protein [Methylobacterium sp. E-016]MCJ2074767.1 hypothetical protein [Methylobacterium sp. E-016]
MSLLATSIAQNPDISINSRSNEILGVEDIPDAPKGKFDTDLFGAALSASSVAIMSLFLATGLRRRGILFAPYGKNKEDILAFISRLSRIDVLSSQFMHQEEKTYVRLADTLYIIAKEIDVAHIDQCVKCLKCPLMCKLIDQSADVVKFHLESLGSAMTDEEYKNILNKRNKFDSVKLRGEIKRMLS